eukprot:12402275-Karenia_brevis.AAC.1
MRLSVSNGRLRGLCNSQLCNHTLSHASAQQKWILCLFFCGKAPATINLRDSPRQMFMLAITKKLQFYKACHIVGQSTAFVTTAAMHAVVKDRKPCGNCSEDLSYIRKFPEE